MLSAIAFLTTTARAARKLRLPLRGELAACIDRLVIGDSVVQTVVPRLRLGKATQVAHPVHAVFEPALCVIAQGSKRVLLGDEVYVYDASNYLVFAQNLPVVGQVLDATPDSPHISGQSSGHRVP